MQNSSITSYPSSINLSRGSSMFSVEFNDQMKFPDSSLNAALKCVDNILSNQTRAINHLAVQYRNSEWSINQLKTSLITLNHSLTRGGKIVISGMGKSFKIAAKIVATLNSLGLHSASLHPSEALHGDLGMIREDHNDCLIIISASGNSPELALMLNYIPITTPVILMTCTRLSALSQNPRISSVLYAELPSHLSEVNLYGLSAPTISTTLCLSLLDAVSIALSELNTGDINIRKSIFGTRHPGGAIGLNYEKEQKCNNNEDLSSFSMDDLKNEISQQKNEKEEVNDKSNDNDRQLEAATSELDLEMVLLLTKMREGKTLELNSLPNDELELLKILVLYDYLIFGPNVSNNGDKKEVIDTKQARDIYREYKYQEGEFKEILWRISELKRVTAF